MIALFYLVMVSCPAHAWPTEPPCEAHIRYDAQAYSTLAKCHAALTAGDFCQRFSIDYAAIRRGENPAYVAAEIKAKP